MEFFEAPPFTRYLRDYMADEEYVSLQFLLAQNPQLGDVMPERAVSANYAGRTHEGARGGEADSGSSTTTSRRISRFGL